MAVATISAGPMPVAVAPAPVPMPQGAAATGASATVGGGSFFSEGLINESNLGDDEIAIGIDLGANWARAAVWSAEDAAARMVTVTDDGASGLRVCIAHVGVSKVLTGNAAFEGCCDRPASTLFGATRLLGRVHGSGADDELLTDEEAAASYGFEPADDEAGSVRVRISVPRPAPSKKRGQDSRPTAKKERSASVDKVLSPEELVYKLLLALKLAAEEMLDGAAVTHAVLVVDGHWGLRQRQAVADSAVMAGLSPLAVLSRYVAATVPLAPPGASARATPPAEPGLWTHLHVDWGGSSCSMALMRGEEVVGVAGDDMLGTICVDRLVGRALADKASSHLIREDAAGCDKRTGVLMVAIGDGSPRQVDLGSDHNAFALRLAAAELRRALAGDVGGDGKGDGGKGGKGGGSRSHTTHVTLHNAFGHALPEMPLSMTAAELEKVLEAGGVWSKMDALLAKVLVQASVRPADVSRVTLAGEEGRGGTLGAHLLRDHFEVLPDACRRLAEDGCEEEAALGAATLAAYFLQPDAVRRALSSDKAPGRGGATDAERGASAPLRLVRDVLPCDVFYERRAVGRGTATARSSGGDAVPPSSPLYAALTPFATAFGEEGAPDVGSHSHPASVKVLRLPISPAEIHLIFFEGAAADHSTHRHVSELRLPPRSTRRRIKPQQGVAAPAAEEERVMTCRLGRDGLLSVDLELDDEDEESEGAGGGFGRALIVLIVLASLAASFMARIMSGGPMLEDGSTQPAASKGFEASYDAGAESTADWQEQAG